MTETASIPVHPDQGTDNRTIPAQPVPFPATVAGCQVIAAALVPARTGEIPNLAEMVLREEGRPLHHQYVVVQAAVRDGKWNTWGGDSGYAYADAMCRFTERLLIRI